MQTDRALFPFVSEGSQDHRRGHRQQMENRERPSQDQGRDLLGGRLQVLRQKCSEGHGRPEQRRLFVLQDNRGVPEGRDADHNEDKVPEGSDRGAFKDLAAAQLEKIQFAHRREHEGKEIKAVNLTLVKMISFTLTSPMKAVNAFFAMP